MPRAREFREFLSMTLQLLELPSWKGARKATTRPTFCHARPALEALEDRAVPASAAGLGAMLGHQAASFLPINVTGITSTTDAVTGVTQLTAVGTVAGQAFSAPITLAAPAASATPAATPILDLHLGPINLNLLGLQVKTSEICLNVSAQPGPGNLLGNLLGGLANALNTPTGIGGFLGGLSSTNLDTLTSGLTNILNGGLGALTDPANATVLPSSTTNILHLEVGPLNLDLLGLVVNLDNCHNGPVTVDVNAVSGSGNLLGNLLSGIAHLADRPNIPAIDHLLGNIGRTLDRLGL